MKVLFVAILLLGWSLHSRADYISYYLIHTGVDHTLKEHERQTRVRNHQALVTTLEETNKTETNRLRSTYDKMISRLNQLGLVIDAAFLTQEAYPTLNTIIRTQKMILEKVADYPYLIPFAIENEIHVVQKAHSLVNYMVGLAVSLGDLNGMKSGDRKLLLGHALNELRTVAGLSYRMLSTLRGRILSDNLRKARFSRWVNREKDLIVDIINNAKKL